MDFIVDFTKTSFQYDAIFVIVYYLTKVANFIPRNTIDDA